MHLHTPSHSYTLLHAPSIDTLHTPTCIPHARPQALAEGQRAAKAQRLDDMTGSLTPGYPARITIFGLEEGDYTFRDCMGDKRDGSTMIVPTQCVMDGEFIECDFEAGLAATIAWYRDNEAWWAPAKDGVEAFYAAKGQ